MPVKPKIVPDLINYNDLRKMNNPVHPELIELNPEIEKTVYQRVAPGVIRVVIH